jgi:hypothetical protein
VYDTDFIASSWCFTGKDFLLKRIILFSQNLQICVGLKGGLIQIYSQKNLVDEFYAPGN